VLYFSREGLEVAFVDRRSIPVSKNNSRGVKVKYYYYVGSAFRRWSERPSCAQPVPRGVLSNPIIHCLFFSLINPLIRIANTLKNMSNYQRRNRKHTCRMSCIFLVIRNTLGFGFGTYLRISLALFDFIKATTAPFQINAQEMCEAD
jgi:hypothetical protein